ncbi:hypothetical protein [Comamonas thiooxydans]|uniref:Uncharacterized protein n=1 Tax=Comamonas thiooxydans TaxID=363952 RepID=A0A0E3BAN2_9BURK|nr:hypothetical protein [Comamonas thiooxydans]KGG85702.1 hypothetical protein P609_12355 [Comamonas thiooxydans]KGG86090.1 hypothetical protein P245_21125 [Comamonas thiooxydans]
MSIRSHEALAAAACQPPAANALIKLPPVTQAVFTGFPLIGTQFVVALLSRAWFGIFFAPSLLAAVRLLSFLPQGVRHA